MYQVGLAIIFILVLLPAQAFGGLSFTKSIVLQEKDKTTTLLTQKIYTQGDKVRIEEDASEIEGNPGVTIYDFKKKKFYTIMLEVKFYIERDINKRVKKDYILFEVPPEEKYKKHKSIIIRRKKLGESQIEGYKTIKYEVKVLRKIKMGNKESEHILEHYFIWRAADLGQIPVRYEFIYPNGAKKIISYTNIKEGPLDKSLFQIPEGYTPISPF